MPNGDVQLMQSQIDQLKTRMTTVEHGLEELNVDLRGNASTPGAFETIRRTSEMICKLDEKTDTVMTTLSDFKMERARILGGVAVVIFIGSIIGWLVSHLLK